MDPVGPRGCVSRLLWCGMLCSPLHPFSVCSTREQWAENLHCAVACLQGTFILIARSTAAQMARGRETPVIPSVLAPSTQEDCGSATGLSITGSEPSPASSPCSASKRFRRENSLPSQSTSHITMMVQLGRADERQLSSRAVGSRVRPSQLLRTARLSGGGCLMGHGADGRFMHHMLAPLRPMTSELLTGASSSIRSVTSTIFGFSHGHRQGCECLAPTLQTPHQISRCCDPATCGPVDFVWQPGILQPQGAAIHISGGTGLCVHLQKLCSIHHLFIQGISVEGSRQLAAHFSTGCLFFGPLLTEAHRSTTVDDIFASLISIMRTHALSHC